MSFANIRPFAAGNREMFVNNLAYEASAGSGKTFMLVVRYLGLLFLGASPSKILTLTFTNKAANEMRERIVSTLEELGQRGELDEISKVTGLSQEYLLQNRQRLLNEFLDSNAKIMTIDAFFTEILRKFSLYASLMPDFSTYNTQHEQKLLCRFLKEVNTLGKKETLIALWLSSDKRLLDIFGLLDEFYIKFGELKEMEFKRCDAEGFEEEALSCMRELREIVFLCKEASSTVLSAVEAKTFEEVCKKSWLDRDTLNYRTFAKCYTPEMDALLLRIKNAIKEYDRAKENNFFYALKELVGIYVKSKKALYADDGELGFGDVTYLVYEILRVINKESDFLYFRLDARIEHILLDEFQDTSIIQYEILKPLITEAVSGRGVHDKGSFFFVGDVKQSIYRFRGGVSALFENVVRDNGTKVEKLLVNYRSKSNIVNFVNEVFIQKIKNYTPQISRSDNEGGYVEIIQSEDILRQTLLQVQRILSLGEDINDIAVLCATNGDGEEIKETLRAEGIDVVTETTAMLINQKSVKALLEYLKYQYFRQDIYMYNFFALLSQQKRDIKKVDLSRTSLLDIAKKAIEEFGIFGGDFNVIRFLDTLSDYTDIESLLFEYERLDASAAASRLRGVRVLTVHKSKGLEYKHVIVIDKLKKPPPKRDAFIYEYDGIELKNIYLRISGRDKVDPEYAAALQKEKALTREDTLNALYVAFTRARESLMIVSKYKDSSFEILELEQQSTGVLKSDAYSGEKIRQEKSVELEYKELYYGTQSDILVMEKQLGGDTESVNFGLAMHYMLEMIDDFALRCIQDAKDMMLNRLGHLLDDGETEDICRRIGMLVQNSEFLSLSDGERYREKAIRYKNGVYYIDLLVKNGDRYAVIDYKSSLKYQDEHKKQVRRYVNAVSDITKRDVSGYICYMLEESIKIVKV